MEPSIKGAVIAKLVEDAQALLERSGDARERLETELSAETLALLDHKLAIGSWYPIAQYRELTELLWREEGDGRIEYLHERGRVIIQRLMEGGLYQQLNYLAPGEGRLQEQRTREQLLTSTKLVGSIMGAILNFSKHSWRFDPDRPDHMLHEISEAADYPDVLRFVQEGVETFLVRLGWPEAPPVTSERVAPDRIVFTSDYTGAFDSRAG